MRTITSLGSFAVKNDGSEDFKTYVLEPLKKVGRHSITGGHEGYYGIFNGKAFYMGLSPELPLAPILTVSQVKEFLSGEDLLASVPNDSSPVVSHPSAFSDTSEQDLYKLNRRASGSWNRLNGELEGKHKYEPNSYVLGFKDGWWAYEQKQKELLNWCEKQKEENMNSDISPDHELYGAKAAENMIWSIVIKRLKTP